MRIALFTGNYVHIEDGVSRTLGRLVGHLVDNGHEVLVLGPTADRPAVEQPGRFVPVPSVSAPGRPEYRVSIRFPSAIRKQVAAFQPDIVHIATPDLLGHAAMRWAKNRALPVVATYHTHFASYLDFYRLGILESGLWALLRGFYNRCDEIYVPTDSMREVLLDHGITQTLRLWPRGVETDRFNPGMRSEAWRATNGFSPDDVVISFVSRLVKEKALDVYADVLDALISLGLPVKALVVGNGPERNALERRLPSAVFAGHLGGSELATAYASSDVFLFPSESETFGNVTLEAMASGLVPVVADATGSRSLVENGRTGFVCPPRNVGAFTQACERLLSHPDEREQLSVAARVEAESYDWNEVLNRMVGFYRHVLSATARPPSSTDS